MTHKKSKTVIASAVSLALASMMLAGGAYAGVIRQYQHDPWRAARELRTNPGGDGGLCRRDGSRPTSRPRSTRLTARCLGIFNKTTGDYPVMGLADYFVSLVMSGTSVVAQAGRQGLAGRRADGGQGGGRRHEDQGRQAEQLHHQYGLPLRRQEPNRGIRLPRYGESGSGHLFKRLPEPQALQDPDAAGIARSGHTPIDLVFNVVDESSLAANRTAELACWSSVPMVNPTTTCALPGVQQDQQLHRQALGRLQGHRRYRYRQRFQVGQRCSDIAGQNCTFRSASARGGSDGGSVPSRRFGSCR